MKTYTATVRSRRRLTIPFDCWMDCEGMETLKLVQHGMQYWWKPGQGLTKNMSYRVTADFEEGTRVELIPDKVTKMITVKKIGPYKN